MTGQVQIVNAIFVVSSMPFQIVALYRIAPPGGVLPADGRDQSADDGQKEHGHVHPYAEVAARPFHRSISASHATNESEILKLNSTGHLTAALHQLDLRD